MRTWRRTMLPVMAAMLSVAAGRARAQPARAALRERFALADDDIDRLDRGMVVSRRLAGVGADEVAFIGAVRLRAPTREAATRVFAGDLPAGGPSLLRRDGFSRPPSARDLETFALPASDVEALRECGVGACDLKLPGDVIGAVRALDWKAPNIDGLASEMMRAWLLEYVRGYVTGGNQSLVIYEDGRSPMALHEGFHALLAAMPFWVDDAPEFHHYLDAFPRQPLPGVHDTIGLYLEDFGLRPLTSVVHSSLYVASAPASLVRGIIARKQIFATHYFRARLSLLAFVDAPATNESYLVWLDRSLFDTRLNRFVRGRVEGELQIDLRARLTRITQTISRP